MVNEIRIIYPCGLNKGFGLKFCEGYQIRREGSRVRQEIPWGRRAHQPKSYVYNNNDKDNRSNNLHSIDSILVSKKQNPVR